MTTRFLIVDDDTVLCELLKEVLNSAGLEAHTMTNSARAAERLQEEKFDGVFLDVRMPPPDGIELARQMRASGFNQRTPIVIITGEDNPSLLKRAFEAGANYFLFKPVDRQRVLRVLRISHAVVQRERRRYQRVTIRCKVTVESQHQRLEGTTLDMSLNGLLVTSGRIFPPKTRVDLSIELTPQAPPLRTAGCVVRVIGEDRMGIQLENLGASESERLQEFLLPRILAAMDQDTADHF